MSSSVSGEASIYSFTVSNNQGEQISLSDFKGKVLLIVNTASRCGFTSQYEGLQKLYEEYHERGLEILAFPCNQFGEQEPGNNAEIAQFCQVNYRITFPIMDKVEVKGPSAAPIYQFLTAEKPGLMGIKAIKWNFTKFLVGRNGHIYKRYAPQVSPSSLEKDIQAALEQ